jgi:DNA-3-methyladenine glycosylase
VTRLTRAELPVDTAALARFLIGKVVVRQTPHSVISGRIVETEAYVVGDAAGHTFRGATPRTRSLFLEHGHAYVYLNYGVSWMLNVSSEAAGIGAGVLIRALEPLEGVEIMRRNRGTDALRRLTRGPGRLTEALRIEGWADGLDLCEAGPLWLAHGDEPADIGQSVRIGLSQAQDPDRVLRFYLRDNPFVSGPKTPEPIGRESHGEASSRHRSTGPVGHLLRLEPGPIRR